MGWPVTTERDAGGELRIGGVGVTGLALEYGTPLYIFDEATLRQRARDIQQTFLEVYPDSTVVYAGKAYLSPTLVNILYQEEIGLDVVSGGELQAGLLAGVPAAAMTFHGNNKSRAELAEAIAAGIGLIAIDNEREIDLLAELVNQGPPVNALLRLNPGVDPHTHTKMRTGAADSKFGFPINDGAAARAVGRIVGIPGMRLVGYHAHVGSQIFDPALVGKTLRELLAFAAAMRDRHRVPCEVISPGGGFGVVDAATGDDVSIAEWAEVAANAIRDECRRHGLPLPRLVVEPGRSIIGPAGVALYEIGARKEIAGIRTYVSVDGGMADNIRPALYGAKYAAVIANRDAGPPVETVTIAGKYCESGDVLINDLPLAASRPGDLLAVPMAGAYCLAMASNYNLSLRPAAVLVGEGRAFAFRRRETYVDILRTERLPGDDWPAA